MENKQETLEEAAEKHSKKMWGVYFNDIHPDVAITKTQGEISIQDFIEGAKWQAEKMYSEEDMYKYAICILTHKMVLTPNEWREQYKKKKHGV